MEDNAQTSATGFFALDFQFGLPKFTFSQYVVY